MRARRILIVPPPQIGGGPSNAVLRCTQVLKKSGMKISTNVLSQWNVALVNVGVGIRFDALTLLRLGRRIVYRADGCYVQEIFEKDGNPWKQEYDNINNRIKIALEKSDHIIYQSQFAKRYLDKIVQRQDGTYKIIHNGVDLDIFNPLGRKHNNNPVIGCIGTFRLNRVRTIADIAKQIPFPHVLLLAGRMDKQCYEDLQLFNAKPGNSEIKYILPVSGDENLAKLHREINCFLHPILSDWCPNSVAEALACGTPVITLNNTGGSELAKDGGIAIDSSRWTNYELFVEEIATAVTRIINDWQFYSNKARLRAENALDVEKMAEGYANALFPNLKLPNLK